MGEGARERMPVRKPPTERRRRLGVDLWLRQDGKFDGDIVLQLTPAETELLHAQLCFALDGEPVTTYADVTPDCRKDPRGFASRMRRP